MFRNFLAVLLITLFVQTPPAEARQAAPVAALPNLIGDVTVRWLGFPMYRATLYSEAARFDWQSRFALELTYIRGFDRDTLVWSTIEELKRMEGPRSDHARIEQSLGTCFRDVGNGDRFVAFAESRDRVSLWFNGQRTCTMSHAQISERFLGIWLSDQARLASVSRKLRGQ